MPRRKRAFIDRSRARTYEIVYRPLGDARDGPERVLRAVPRGNASDPRFADAGDAGDTIAYSEAPVPVSEWEGDYIRERSAYELGEYGLPDDGYNYSKHFKRIGGGAGGVFVERGGRTDAGGEGCNEVDAVGAGERMTRQQDERRKRLTELDMTRKRVVDKELDEVLAALEASSEGDDFSDSAADVEDGDPAQFADAEESESEPELDDDFVSKARVDSANANAVAGRTNSSASPARKEVKPRAARLLDEQFDELMLSYGESGLDVDCDDDGEDGTVDASGSSGRGDASGDDDSSDALDGRSELDDSLLSALAADLPAGASRVDNDLDRAMEHLVGQYKRATVDETYIGPDSVRAPEALEGVRKAAARHFESGGDTSNRLPPTDSHGNNIREYESEEDEADEDYITSFETVVERRVADKWDCETVLSTYTNVDNHPSVIDDGPGGRRAARARRRDPIIRLDPRTSLPTEFMPPLPEDAAEEDDTFYAERTDTAAAHVTVRDRNESADAKRARKTTAKAAARERRAEKSATKKAFSDEFKKQGHHDVRLGKSKVAVRF